MATLSEATRTGEWLKWMAKRAFCLEVLTLKSATVQSIETGSPLRDDTGFVLVVNGTEVLTSAISLENIEATGDEKVLALVRGPALIDRAQLHYEADVLWSEIASVLADLDIRAYPVDATWQTQTT